MILGQRIHFVALGAILAAVALLSVGWTSVRADHDPGSSTIDIVAFDMVNSGNSPTGVGTVEDCVALAAVGNTTTVDLIVDQVPADGAGGIEGKILYSSSIVRVNASVGTTMMLGAGANSSVTGFTNSVPDTDGSFGFAYIDSSTDYESGEGVMVRLTFQAVGTGRASISVQDPDGNPYPLIYAPDTSAYAIDNVFGGTIAVGVPCATNADLHAFSANVSSPSSAAIGTPFDVTVTGEVRNNGPVTPANADITALLSMPADCTAAGGSNSHTIENQSIATGTPYNVNEVFSVTCTTASFHSLAATISVALDDPAATDTVSTNNQISSSSSTTAITATADLTISSVTITTSQVTPTPMAGSSLDLVATIGVRNNGPNGPVEASGLATPSVPSVCTVWSPNNPASFNATVPASTTVNVVVTWHLRCTNYGDQSLGASATVAAQNVHVVDAGGNNSGSGSATFPFKRAYCGDDPNPNGIHPSPQLLAIIQQLTATGAVLPAASRYPIDCLFGMDFFDKANTPNDDCPVAVPEQPCSISFPLRLDLPGGSPLSTPTGQLNPIGIVFAPPEIDWANDTEITNGSVAGAGSYGIRTDGGLLPNNIKCTIDANFALTQGTEGAILGNAPESNARADLKNPNVWPNNLNAEKKLVETALKNPVTSAPGITLWSRIIVPLKAGGLAIDMNILVWKITDPAIIGITGPGWVIVPFPGDVVNPDLPGTIGGNPDAEDPAPLLFPLNYCMPHFVTLTFNGMAGGNVYLSCGTVADPFGWVLVDPDAVNVSQDQGQRSDTSKCSVDADGDGLGSNSESYWGTNPNNVDTDGDGVQDGPDNCRTTSNAGQADYDSDGIGDICDPDVDGDGANNGSDLCPNTVPGAQADSSGCSKAQVDSDGDNWCDPGAPSGGPAPCTPTDNCPSTVNADQANHDGDGLGDACDPDIDGDGKANASDTCAFTPVGEPVDMFGCSDSQVDADGDRVCDPGAPAPGPSACTGSDNCPDVPNAGQENFDGDAFGNACDLDVDADGKPNTIDLCQFTALGAQTDNNGCSQAQVDSDADNICNPGAPSGGPAPCAGSDNCPTVSNAGQANGDGDEYGDACDPCPTIVNHWPIPPNDSDCDGFSDSRETYLGTNPNIMCPPTTSDDVWPPDISKNKLVNGQDYISFNSHFFSRPGDGNWDQRFDLSQNSLINGQDWLMLNPFFSKRCDQ